MTSHPAMSGSSRTWSESPVGRHDRDYVGSIPRWLGIDDKALVPFAPLVDLLLAQNGSRETLQGLQLVELGPGRRTALSAHLTTLLGDHFTCVGLPRFGSDLASYRFEDINAYLARRKRASIDIALSRHVLEENSFHPLTLLRSPAFRTLLRRGKSEEVMRQLPGSRSYLARTMRELARTIRPGGKVIGMVVDRRRADCIFEEATQRDFEVVVREAIGRRRGRFVLRRRGKSA